MAQLILKPVEYKKVEGSLSIYPNGVTTVSKKDPIVLAFPSLPLPALPLLVFVPTSGSASGVVVLPFSSINTGSVYFFSKIQLYSMINRLHLSTSPLHTELQSSVANKPPFLLKFEVLPASIGTAPFPGCASLTASIIFNFVGEDAGKNRDAAKKALPSFPFVAPVVVKADPASDPSNQNPLSGNLGQNQATQKPTASGATEEVIRGKELGRSAPKPPSSLDSMDVDEMVASDTIEGGVISREERIQRLRRDESLRAAYRDLVVAEPHIYTDAEFWQLYARQSGEDEDETPTEDKNKAEQESSSTSSLLHDPQTRSVESELILSPGSGFLDLLKANFDPATGRLKLMLTPALRRQIYDEFPMVRLAFEAQVPTNMKPAVFWDSFFKAQLDKLLANAKKRKEEEEQASKRKKAVISGAKKNKGKQEPSTPVTNEEMTWEQRQTRFFASLTDPLPERLNRLVWQSKVSDVLHHDPSSAAATELSPLGASPFFTSTSSSSASLLPMALEDGESNPLAMPASPFVVTRPPQVSTFRDEDFDSETQEPIASTSSDTPGDDFKKSMKTSKSASSASPTVSAPSPLLSQQDSLRNRMLRLMQGNQPPSPAPSAKTASSSAPSNTSTSDTITAEELLFSALREEANLEQRQRNTTKTVTPYGTVLPKSLSGTGPDGSLAQTKQLPEGAIELLDGLVVEAGELDESSMTELRREKEKRNLQLQLIRKFNRHSNLIVTSSGDADDNKAEEEKHLESKGYHIPQAPESTSTSTKFGASVAEDTTDALDTTDVESAGGIRAASNATLDPLVILPTPTTADQISSYDASPSSMFAVLDDLNSLLERRKQSNLSRLLPPRLAHSLPRPSGSRLDIQTQELDSFFARCEQWRRHFWTIIERLPASNSSATSTPGTNKLAHIVKQLKDLEGILSEMILVEMSAQAGELDSSLLYAALLSQKRSIQCCMDVFQKLSSHLA